MNELQYERWKQLGLGLARGYRNLTAARQAKLLDEVECCIGYVACNGLETVEDWDCPVERDGIRWECAGDRVRDYLWDGRYEFERQYKNGNIKLVRGRFGDTLTACVRAGFDVAVAPGGGVIGFTVGDLRDVFDGPIPDWVAGHFEDPAALLAAGRDEVAWL